MRILRCERCEKPRMLTTLEEHEIFCCPAGFEEVEWRQVNKTPAA